MQTFKEFREEDEIEYLIVDIPEELIDNSLLLLEGQWIDSSKKGYKMRIDKPTDHTQKLHVHIAKDKHTKSKNYQASWNQDGSRHDKKTFNTNLGSSSAIQNVARQALNISDNIILEEYVPTKLGLILENIELTQQLEIKPNCRLIVKL